MEIYAAIDILDGRVVRLFKGDYTKATIYENDPVAVACSFAEAGARWMHVVDLDAAKGEGILSPLIIERICRATGIHVQIGGGIRSVKAARTCFEAGASRVVLGTLAVENPSVTDAIVSQFPCQVAIGLDAHGRNLATRGWRVSSGIDIIDIARYFDRPEISAFVITEINRDGTLKGPSFQQIRSVLGHVSVPIIASGGVGGIKDLQALSRLESNGRRLSGAIVGKALYEGKFSLREALKAC